jgi:hypothetical protein
MSYTVYMGFKCTIGIDDIEDPEPVLSRGIVVCTLQYSYKYCEFGKEDISNKNHINNHNSQLMDLYRYVIHYPVNPFAPH